MWTFQGNPIFCFEDIEQNVIPDRLFYLSLRQSWRKMLPHQSVNWPTSFPAPLFQCWFGQHRYYFYIEYPNIEWWDGEGKGVSWMSIFNYCTKIMWMYKMFSAGECVLATRRQVWQRISARIVWVICKKIYLELHFAQYLQNKRWDSPEKFTH